MGDHIGQRRIMVIDVESIGLHGEAFAVAAVTISLVNSVLGIFDVLDEFLAACPQEQAKGPGMDRDWVAEHVKVDLANFATTRGVRDAFWEHWMEWRAKGTILAAECAWPVEARFLAQCVDDAAGGRNWDGPYPLVDISSIMLAAGMDPLGSYERMPGSQTEHNPTHDARHSAYLLSQAYTRLRSMTHV